MKEQQLNNSITLSFYENEKLEQFEEYLEFKRYEAGTSGMAHVEIKDIEGRNNKGKEFMIQFYSTHDAYMFGYGWAWEQIKNKS